MKYASATLVFLCGEILAMVVFGILKKRMWPEGSRSASRGATAKGMLERLTLFCGMLHGFPQILIAFGALKLGTRLHEEKENPISNSYFLVGNLLSILLAMVYTIVSESIWGSFSA